MRLLSIFLLLIVISGCQQQKKEEAKVNSQKSEHNVVQKHAAWVNLERKVSKKIDNWQEYRSLNEFIQQYKSISSNEALNNSKELNDLVKILKDSVKPEFLVSSAFDARINHLHNETLRLYDMSSISSIKHDEVNLQVEKLLEAFSAINSKMNTIVKQADLDEQVNDPKFKRVVSDTAPKPKETPKKLQETPAQYKMRLSKEQRNQNRQLKLQAIQKKQDEKKKKNN